MVRLITAILLGLLLSINVGQVLAGGDPGYRVEASEEEGGWLLVRVYRYVEDRIKNVRLEVIDSDQPQTQVSSQSPTYYYEPYEEVPQSSTSTQQQSNYYYEESPTMPWWSGSGYYQPSDKTTSGWIFCEEKSGLDNPCSSGYVFRMTDEGYMDCMLPDSSEIVCENQQ